MLITFIFASLLLQEPSRNASSLSDRVVDAIDHHYLYADSGSWKALRSTLLAQSSATASSIDKELMQLNDGDLHIVTAEQMTTMQTETAGNERGIGLVDFAVTLNPDTGRPQIVTALVDSPAYKAGLLPRDVIVSINGKSTQGLVHEGVMALLRSDSRAVKLTIRRGGHERSVDIPGSSWHEKTVLSHEFTADNKPLGYIAVRLFTPDSGDLVRKAVESFATHGTDRCVLDLRNNPGGYLDAMAATGSAFTDHVLGWKIRRDGTREPIQSSSPALKRMRLAILVNEGTASAAEILAEGLRDTIGARLVGSKTFGRGQIQTYVALSDAAGIVIPAENVQSVKGVQFNKRSGLKPDFAVASSMSSGREDAAYLRAVQLLTHG
jgi:carboxyl-terminal processing protease